MAIPRTSSAIPFCPESQSKAVMSQCKWCRRAVVSQSSKKRKKAGPGTLNTVGDGVPQEQLRCHTAIWHSVLSGPIAPWRGFFSLSRKSPGVSQKGGKVKDPHATYFLQLFTNDVLNSYRTHHHRVWSVPDTKGTRGGSVKSSVSVSTREEDHRLVRIARKNGRTAPSSTAQHGAGVHHAIIATSLSKVGECVFLKTRMCV